MPVTVPLTKLLPQVISEVPSCPVSVVIRYLNMALIEFCAETLYHHEPFDAAIPTVSGTAEYTLAPPAGYKLAMPARIEYEGAALYPATDYELSFESPEWRKQSGTPYCYVMVSPTLMRLHPTPDAVGDITGELAIKPDRDNTNLFEDIYDDYAEVIEAGALARLMAMKGKEWFSAGVSEYHRGIFDGGIADAKVKRLKGFSASILSVAPTTIGV